MVITVPNFLVLFAILPLMCMTVFLFLAFAAYMLLRHKQA